MATTNKAFSTPANGADVDTWDVPVNANWNSIDNSLGGTTSINAVSASGTVTLTLAQYIPPRINITGALTANVNYQLPSGVGGFWSVSNGTTGAYTITISSAGAGSSIVVPQGKALLLFCDGTNVTYGQTAPTNIGGSNTQIQYNSSGLFAGSANLTFDGSNLSVGGNITAKNSLLLTGSTSGNVGLSAAAISDSTAYVWPGTDGSAGTLLTTDGAGNLTWITPSTGVLSISGGTTGLTPSGPTGGSVVLGGTLALTNGGTGQTTAQAAMNALAGGVTSGNYLRGSGSNIVLSAIQAADVPTLNQNTTGNAATATAATALATARSISMTGNMTWTISAFDGSANVTAVGTIQAGAVTGAMMASGAAVTNIGFTPVSSVAAGVPQQGIMFSLSGGSYSLITSFGGVTASRASTGDISVVLSSTALILGYFIGQADESSQADGIPVDGPGATLSASNTYTFKFRAASSKTLTDPDRVLLLFY